MEQKRTEKYEEARSSLPPELLPVFDELVTDYRWATERRYGKGYVAYSVLADLIRSGWRPTKQSIGNDEEQIDPSGHEA